MAGLRAEVGSRLGGWTGGSCPTASVSRLASLGCSCVVCGEGELEAHCTGSSGLREMLTLQYPGALSRVVCAVQGAGGAVRNKECPLPDGSSQRGGKR